LYFGFGIDFGGIGVLENTVTHLLIVMLMEILKKKTKNNYMKEETFKIIIILGLMTTVALLPILGIWDIWDDVNEGVIAKLFQSDLIALVFFCAIQYLISKYEADKKENEKKSKKVKV
jgi:quinol-cytochrome oxidoreductase complex cytochrome b subunit